MSNNLYDSHSHSNLSADGKHSMADMAEVALSKGMSGLAITNHIEGDDLDKYDYAGAIAKAEGEAHDTQQRFKGRLDITYGIEVGQVFYNQAGVEAIVNARSYDFIIGSHHRLMFEQFDFYMYHDYDKMPTAQLHKYIEKYYEEHADLIKWGKFDVLGHITLPIRYPAIYNNVRVDITKYSDYIDEVLKLAISNCKGIEVNTSGLRNALGDTLPPQWVINRYRELGGEIITIGSDAHNKDDVGEGIARGMEMLKTAGFKYVSFFKERKPLMIKID